MRPASPPPARLIPALLLRIALACALALGVGSRIGPTAAGALESRLPAALATEQRVAKAVERGAEVADDPPVAVLPAEALAPLASPRASGLTPVPQGRVRARRVGAAQARAPPARG